MQRIWLILMLLVIHTCLYLHSHTLNAVAESTQPSNQGPQNNTLTRESFPCKKTRTKVRGHAMIQEVGRRSLIAEASVRLQTVPCCTCDGQSGSGASFSQSTPTNALYWFIHPSKALHNLKLTASLKSTLKEAGFKHMNETRGEE